MFVPPRFVAVDDKEHHLRAILSAFQAMGTPCMGVVFNPAEELNPQAFSGVRALFLDLHLVEGGAKSDQRSHYAQIQQILEDNISANGGPFILVLWTEHAQNAPDLIAYLDKNIAAERPYARPLAVIPLAKDEFINTENGAVRAAGILAETIERVLNDNSQMQALISWEMDVLAAAGATLSSLLSLVPAAERSTGMFPAAVDTLLSRLAREAVGRAHVATDPRLAVVQALAPILADRVLNQSSDAATRGIWSRAVTRFNDPTLPKITLGDAGQLNRILHIADGSTESLDSGDWGTVSELPADLSSDESLRSTFGVVQSELLGDEFKVKPEDYGSCRLRLVRVGAACDYAQDRPGPVSLLIALEVPSIIKTGKATDAIWSSPYFTRPGFAEVIKLHVHCRLGISRVAATVAGWTPSYRLREPVMMQLVNHAGTYAARPGIVSFSPTSP